MKWIKIFVFGHFVIGIGVEFMKKSQGVNDILKFIIFIAVLATLAYLVFMGISNMTLNTKIEKANKKAEITKTAAQAWIDFYENSNNIKIRHLDGVSDAVYKAQSVGSKISIADEKNSNTVMDLKPELPTGFNGYWVVVVDSITKEIKYTLWSEEVIKDSQIKDFLTLEEQTDFCKKEDILLGYAE